MNLGNNLIDENEFLLWVEKIQSLREPNTENGSSSSGATSQQIEEDDVNQDLVAAFR